MKNYSVLSFFLTILLMVFAGCNKEENDVQQLQLQAIGFTGTLPDNGTFGKSGIVAENIFGSSSSSDDGSYIRTGLAIMDTATKISIQLELPDIKFSNDFKEGKEDDGTYLKQIARTYYPYELVKEKLSVGEKILVSSQAPDVTKSFRLQVNDNSNYKGYISGSGYDQTGSYLKVMELTESTETDPVLGKIKTLDVIFDIDVKLYRATEPKAPPVKFKGLLRMKFRDNY